MDHTVIKKPIPNIIVMNNPNNDATITFLVFFAIPTINVITNASIRKIIIPVIKKPPLTVTT
jgi:S-ribosylhomocysteine lyase LuxS involved in autoinducer biosynthesis